jgi:hypothetical protein
MTAIKLTQRSKQRKKRIATIRSGAVLMSVDLMVKIWTSTKVRGEWFSLILSDIEHGRRGLLQIAMEIDPALIEEVLA